MFTRDKMSSVEEIHRGVYASVVQTGKATRERMFTLQKCVCINPPNTLLIMCDHFRVHNILNFIYGTALKE